MPLSDERLASIEKRALVGTTRPDLVIARGDILDLVPELRAARKVVEAVRDAETYLDSWPYAGLVAALAEYDALSTPAPEPTSRPSGA